MNRAKVLTGSRKKGGRPNEYTRLRMRKLRKKECESCENLKQRQKINQICCIVQKKNGTHVKSHHVEEKVQNVFIVPFKFGNEKICKKCRSRRKTKNSAALGLPITFQQCIFGIYLQPVMWKCGGEEIKNEMKLLERQNITDETK